MKYLLTTACLVLAVACPAKADDAKPMTAAEACPQVGELARVIMDKRQHEMSMATLMAAIEKLASGSQGNQAIAPVARSMVMMAYDEPSYQTEEMQQRSIAEFVNKAELTCYQHLK